MLGCEDSIRLVDVAKTFQGNDKKVLTNLNLEVSEGLFLSLLGPSGCGKTTLLKILAGLEDVSSGRVHIPSALERSFSYVFQEPQLLPWRTVRENVELPFWVGSLREKYSVTEVRDKVFQVLEQVRLVEAQDLFPHQLSGGMKMRVALARALVTSPRLLLMDEPFAALDEVTRFEMQDLLLKIWHSQQMTVVFVTHSISEAVYLSQKIFMFKNDHHYEEKVVSLSLSRNQDLRLSPQISQVIKELSEEFRK